MPFVLALLILIIVVALVYGKPTENKRKVGLYLSIFTFAVNTIFNVIFYLNSEASTFVPQGMPLWYCGLIAPVAIYGFWRMNSIALSYVYLAAMTPNLIACFTPEVIFNFPHVEYIAYFFSHAMNMVLAFYLVFAFPFRMNFKQYRTVVLIAYAIIFLSHLVNTIFGTNFNYTSYKPTTLTMLDSFGEWPYYLFYAQFIGLATTFVSYMALRLKTSME